MYSLNSRVRYSELGSNQKMSLSSIVNYFQDCSTFESEDLGIGMNYFYNYQRAWVLSSWQIIVNEYPSLGEEITTSTWAYGFKGIYGYRNFIMKNKNEDLLAYANSIWVCIDTENGQPARIPEDLISNYNLKDRIDMDYAPRKIRLPKNLETLASFPVVNANLDTNGHVNNGQYILMGEEFLPENFKVRQMRADYRKSALLGDTIVPMVTPVDESLYIVVLADTNGKPYTSLEFKQ